MDVEGLLDLEDYVPPQAEKQIAKKPQKPPQYEMDPSFWQYLMNHHHPMKKI